ncbi:MAG: hybrid sensor histidine kinase/response regulator [Halioglobus sp.]|nr:hybrid sensor histidine kinase/response regulator [Halioglobus sp.]
MEAVSQLRHNKELLKQWGIQVKQSPAPVIVAMAMVAYMASQYVAAWYWASWLLCVIIVQAVRYSVYLGLPDRTDVPIEIRVRRVVRINLVGTLLHSLSLVWFPLFTPFQAAVQSILLVGMSMGMGMGMGMGVGAVMISAGYATVARAHAFFGLVPLCGLWVWSGLFGPGGGIALILGLLGFGYMALLLRISENMLELYEESSETRSQLETALENAEAAGRSKTRFLASASHDLRQPMHALSLFSAALATRDLEDDTSEIAHNINASVEALSCELDGLLDISRLDAGIVTVNRYPVCLAMLLRRLVQDFSALASQRCVRIHIESPPIAPADTDGVLFERIVRNLISNAINHNTDCDLILKVQGVDEHWHVELKDTGQGIDSSEQAKIFEEFYQLENPERDRAQGLGLGLSIVRRLSALLDACMEFESTPGRGTTFGFKLVAIEGRIDCAEPSDTSVTDLILLQSLVVLVVDDEISVRTGMRALLGNLGCKVLAADDMQSALALAQHEQPDIVLADFKLRDEHSGLEVIRRLQAVYHDLPAVVISGDTAPECLQEIGSAHIPLLIKPVLIGPLKSTIIRTCFSAT